MGFKHKVPRKVGTSKHCIIKEGKEEAQKRAKGILYRYSCCGFTAVTLDE
jgi:hypothetical protein